MIILKKAILAILCSSLCALLFFACSSTQIKKNNHTLQGPPAEFNHKGAVILSASFNFHGTHRPQAIFFSEPPGDDDSSLYIGGAVGLKSYLKVLEKKYGAHHIHFEAGEIFPRQADVHFEANINFFKELPLAFQVNTLSDFEYFLLEEQQFTQRSPHFTASNLVDVRSSDFVKKNYLSPYHLIEVNGVKILITSFNFPSGLHYQQSEYMNGKIWQDPILSYLKIMDILKNDEIHFRISLIQANNIDDVRSFIRRLPPNSVDLVIVGGSLYEMPKKIQGVPLMHATGRSKSLQMKAIYLEDEKIKSSKIYDIQTCHHFYQATQDCYIPSDRQQLTLRQTLLEKSDFKLSDALFLGENISEIILDLAKDK